MTPREGGRADALELAETEARRALGIRKDRDEAPQPSTIAWSPFQRERSSSFRTHGVRIRGEVARVVRSRGYIAFMACFYGPALAALFLGVPHNIARRQVEGVVFMLLFAAVFGRLSWLLFRGERHLVFDRLKGVYYLGPRFDSASFDRASDGGPLQRIHALQIVSEWIDEAGGGSTDSKSYWSHEVNLILDSGRRVHVIDHGDRAAIDVSAMHLADFLGVPIWAADVDGELVSTVPGG